MAGYAFACEDAQGLRARLVASAQDWPWSSTRAHLAGEDDGLVNVRPVLERIADFAVRRAISEHAAHGDSARVQFHQLLFRHFLRAQLDDVAHIRLREARTRHQESKRNQYPSEHEYSPLLIVIDLQAIR